MESDHVNCWVDIKGHLSRRVVTVTPSTPAQKATIRVLKECALILSAEIHIGRVVRGTPSGLTLVVENAQFAVAPGRTTVWQCLHTMARHAPRIKRQHDEKRAAMKALAEAESPGVPELDAPSHLPEPEPGPGLTPIYLLYYTPTFTFPIPFSTLDGARRYFDIYLYIAKDWERPVEWVCNGGVVWEAKLPDVEKDWKRHEAIIVQMTLDPAP